MLKFVKLDVHDDQAIKEMSALATAIVKEHFDPIIGPAQNDYMIERFQSADAIAAQLAKGYRYYFVVAPSGERIGFLAVTNQPDSLYLSKFYLRRDQRGRGYAHQMMDFVSSEARSAGFGSITLNVNKRNDARFAYEAMGFHIIREEANDIGAGFVMDDYVYELEV